MWIPEPCRAAPHRDIITNSLNYPPQRFYTRIYLTLTFTPISAPIKSSNPTLKTAIATITKQFGGLIIKLRNEIQSLRARIDKLKQINQANHVRIHDRTTSTNPRRPKPNLPNLEKFNGKTYKFNTWLPAIRAKLRIDSPAIGDSTAQFYYIYSNLESNIQAMVLPQLSYAKTSHVYNYKLILSQLLRVYNNPNKVQEAKNKLHYLCQGIDSLSVYMAKFERVLYKAQG